MFYASLSNSNNIFPELARFRQEIQSLFEARASTSAIRSVAQGTFPAINIANTSNSIVVHAFAPGVDPSTLDVSINHGVLHISGQRVRDVPDANGIISVYAAERFTGRFDRKLAIPDIADSSEVEARYSDGVLRITLARKQKPQPKRINIQ